MHDRVTCPRRKPVVGKKCLPNVIDSFNRCEMLIVFVFIKVSICRLFSEKANPLVDEVEG
jgi:hypothetical protein